MGWEESLLEELFHQYSPIIYRYIYFVTKCKEEAEDLTQEVFIKAYRGLAHYRGESSYKTWLYTIARNVIIDQYRKQRKTDCLTDIPLPDLNQLGPEVLLDLKEDTQLLHRAIMELTFPYREIVILRKIKGYSTSETANILGWEEGKVKVTLHRALHRLRDKLNPSARAS
ncbi:RNA polymerase sigma-70 factor (ECF subfamily) [Bacillus sp. SORGH_AS 510]|uniref:RNA polymerase sigma factor n=1 Tax=Bacillus sp. SORGH_AS_0510 TaxID=3041771 RepID=UPI002783A5C6|nr:RNA polymerase sigma factor [Bacillus sp. SORGH_AS_0510]MDQ1143911.1 RNA polymerase sigma-70 factor (ECF subfamily) [Bacillus sp. SORGH_AS_0510]